MKKLRYFIDAIDGQQNWLNKMAQKGYRLTGTTRMGYEFTSCEAGAYHYVVQYVADKSLRELTEYRQYLEEMGYVYYAKNINLQFGVKAKLRYTGKALKLATNPGILNQELLLIEVPKQDELQLFTSAKELHDYYAMIRNGYILATIMILLIAFFGRTKLEFFGTVYMDQQFPLLQIVLCLFSIPFFVVSMKLICRTRKWKKEMHLYE